MANTVCKADAENFLASLESHQLDIDTSDVTLGTFSKAFKFASRTKMKVGRAFSFNKTPSKLKRAVSTMMRVLPPGDNPIAVNKYIIYHISCVYVYYLLAGSCQQPVYINA